MEKNKYCKIVRDLLPSYAYNLTLDETNKFVEEHLENCEACKKVLQDIKDEERVVEEVKANKYINVAKKYNIKMKFLIIIIIAILLLIFCTTFLRNIIIIESLSNKANKYINSNNFHIVWSSYNADSSTIFDIYYKDGKYIEKMSNYNYKKENNVNQIISYYDGKGTKADYFCNQKVVSYIDISEDSRIKYPTIVPQNTIKFTEKNIMNFIQLCLMNPISLEKCNNIECYRLKYITMGNNNVSYIEKDTGLTVRSKVVTGYDNKYTDTFSDIMYEFNQVTDKDIDMPSTDGYTIQK